MTEVANLPFDADEVYKQDANRTLGDKEAWQIRGWRCGERGQGSPSLTRTPFIAGHMTSPTVQAGMVYLAPFAHL